MAIKFQTFIIPSLRTNLEYYVKRLSPYTVEFDLHHHKLGQIGTLSVERWFKTRESALRFQRYVHRYFKKYGRFPNLMTVQV